MAKKLIINCATCDARNALEENYAHYEQITVNCASGIAGVEQTRQRVLEVLAGHSLMLK